MALEQRIRLSAAKQIENLKKDKGFRKLSIARKTAVMANLVKGMEQEAEARRQRLQELVTRNRMASKREPGGLGLGQAATTFATQFADTSLFGRLPEVIGAATAPLTAEPGQVGQEFRDVTEQARLEFEAGQQSSPRAALAGDISAFLNPTTPISRVVGGAGRLASGGLQRLATRGGFRGGAAQVAGNVAGGTAAVGALNLFQSNPGADLSDRFDQFVDQASNPLLLGLNVSLGGVSAALRTRTGKAERAMLKEFTETIPGARVSPDVPREGTFLGSQLANMFANFQRFPGFDFIRQKFLRNAVYEPLGRAIERLENSVSPIRGQQAVERGARALTALVGKKKGRGRIERRIRGIEKQAFAEEGEILIRPKLQNRLTKELREFIKSEVKGKGIKELTTPMVGLLRRVDAAIEKATKANKTISINQLEDLRQELVNIGRIANRNPAVMSDLDRRLATRTLDTINEIYRLRSPKIKAAFESAEVLRAMRSLFPKAGQLNRLDPGEILATVGSGKGAIQRWEAMQQFLTPVEVQVARGDYLRRFIEHVASKKPGGQMINAQTFNTALQQGQFAEPKMRAILGDALVSEIKIFARFSERMSRGIAQGEGSQTIRGVGAAAVMVTLANIPLLVSGLMRSGTIRAALALGVLGNAGVGWLAHSLLNGRAGPLLNRLATGQPIGGLARSAAFVGDRGFEGIVSGVAGVIPPEERTQFGSLILEESR